MKDDVPHDAASIDAGVVGADTLHSQTRLPADSPTPPPIPDYELLRCIGRGSYGEVWLARNVMGEYRAVKIVHRAAFGGDSRPFEREFEGIRKFEPISRSHESQLPILHVGLNEAAGCFYYVMELADDASVAVVVRKLVSDDGKNARPHPGPLPRGEGESSSARRQVEALQNIDRRPIPVPSPGGEGKGEGGPTSQLSTQTSLNYIPRTLRLELERHGRLPLAQCLDIGLALTTALAHLHKHGLVHRDIKPSNIIFVQGRPKLADIGLVTDVGDARSIVGTEGYLAPEGPGSPQADLYSLGKVLYEISTGRDRRHFPDLPLDLQPRTPSSQLNVGSSALNVERSTSNAQHSTVEPRAFPELRSSRREEAQTSKSAIANRKSEITQGLLELNEILLKACARDPRQRYQSGEEMHADLALLQAGKSVRRARGNHRLWAKTRKLAATFVLLCVLAAGVVYVARQTQRIEASGDGPPSTNDLANALCAKALHIIRGDQYPAFAEAYTNFHQAIRLDPHFARPYVGLFELRMSDYVPGLPDFTTGELDEIAKKLTELAPQLAVTYSAQSVVAYCESDYAKAREYGLRATLADPDCAPARATYGWFLTTWGWPKEGRKEIEVARRLRPSKSSYHQLLANTYYMERDFPKAIEMYRESLRWESHREIPYQGIASASLAMGDTTTAISNLEQLRIVTGTQNAKSKAWFEELRQAVAEQGALGYWRKLATSYAKNPETNFYSHAVCQMHLGNTNDTFALLEKSLETRERTWILPVIYLLVIEPTWDGVRDHARFQKLLDRIGFTKVMPKRP